MTPGEAGPDGSALRLSAAWVAAQMRGELTVGGGEREFGNVSIDTRTLKAGDLYFGVRGDRFDGADFAGDAIATGAAGVVVPRGWSGSNAGPKPGATSDVAQPFRAAVVIEVDDTTVALQDLAHGIRKASAPKSWRLRAVRARPRRRK